MKRIVFSSVLFLFAYAQLHAFCGVFVAAADSKLFNESSSVILVRNGDESVLIMSNDYQGEPNEFAMIVPVPVVLGKDDISIADAGLFTKFDQYSAPRMTMYYDESPCPREYHRRFGYRRKSYSMAYSGGGSAPQADRGERNYGVTIEAQYAVGEYDILILSAKESGGLKDWLKDNNYNLPLEAAEVLDPYIKSNMKFFVAKVNLERTEKSAQTLNPIKIKYKSDKFMLPIRLGMANSSGTQDLVVYALTQTGRVECTNYRTVKMPSDRNVPTFVQQKFGAFYKDIFENKYKEEHKNSVFLEYAWDCSQMAQMKCDPCNGQPPVLADLQKAGVPWANDAEAKTFFTRLHVRYDRANFPQDLQFQVTPNKENYQVRYYMKKPATNLDCDDAGAYIKTLVERRKYELNEMERLSGWSAAEQYATYVTPYESMLDANGNVRGKENGTVIFNFDTGYLDEEVEVNRAEIGGETKFIFLQLMGYGALLLFGITLIRKFTGAKDSGSS